MTNWWLSVRKIATLPSVKLTPRVVLARSLEKATAHITEPTLCKKENITNVYVAIKYWDGTYAADYSQMSIADLMFHREMLTRIINKQLDATEDFGRPNA